MTRYIAALTLSGVIDEAGLAELDRGLSPIFDCAIRAIHKQVRFGCNEFFTQDLKSNLLPSSVEELCSKLALSFGWHCADPDHPSLTWFRVCDRVLGQDVSFKLNDDEYIKIPAGAEELAERWRNTDDVPPLLIAKSNHDALKLAADPVHAGAAQVYLKHRANAA